MDIYSLNFSKYISNDYVQWLNDSGKHSSIKDKTTFPNTYNGFWRDDFYQCYGINVPFRGDIVIVSALIDGKIFPTSIPGASIRPSEGNHIFTIFHYPNQLINSIQNIRYLWPTRKNDVNFMMKFQLNGVEMLERRNKPKSPCITNWKEYDDNVLLEHAIAIGCRAPYQLFNKSIPICSTQNKMLLAMIPLTMDVKNKFPPPCRNMEKIYYEYSEHAITTDWSGRGKFAISLYIFDQTYKEIKQSR